MVPRIQGKIGQASEPKELRGKWFFELWLSDLGGQYRDSLGNFGPFETELEAQAELRKTCQLACETLEQEIAGEVSGKYFDINSKALRYWDKRDEN